MTEVYTRAGSATGSCVLGSVKSQIGHTKCAAGMAGLIKAALAIHHGVLPPTANIKSPNPAWQQAKSPFVFLDQARPWASEKRVAAVSAFGFGGTNFHAVLASHDGAFATDVWPSELVLCKGADRAAAIARVEKLCVGERRLRDIARTTCADRGPVQLAIVATSVEDLRAKLVKPDKDCFAANPVAGKLALLCPGQGSQKPGMLADLFVAFPRLHGLLELGAKWLPKLYPATAYTKEAKAAQQDAITDTRVAQPTLGIVELAAAHVLRACGVRPDMAAGHSYGELAALCIAGALDEADLLALSEKRGEHILAAGGADPGTMAAVAADATTLAKIVDGTGVVIANHNSPKQCVLSGPTPAIDDALARLKIAGLGAKKIPVACAFHSPVVASAKDALARELAALDVRDPDMPVWSNVTAEPYGAGQVRALLAEQVASPVKFAPQIEAMYAAGARIFVEAGPGQVLTRLVGEILGDRPHLAVSIDDPGKSPAGGAGGLPRALAQLAAGGVSLDTDALFWDRDAAIIEAAPPKKKSWLVNGHLARPADGQPPRKATPVTIVHSPAPGVSAPAPAGTASANRDGAVIEYLRTMRAMITAQRDVMLSYFGAQPAPMVEMAPVIDVIAAPAPAAQRQIAAAPAAPAPAAPAPVVLDPMQLVLDIVSERTGYPIETLGVDLDLEADLSIDSIKRIEIIGELALKLGLRVENGAGDADAIVEELATRKTLRALVAWLSERMANKTAAPAQPIVAAPVSELEEMATMPTPETARLRRFRLEIAKTPAPVNGHTTLADQRYAIFDGGDVGKQLATRLTGEGAKVRQLGPGEAVGEVDGYVDLGVVDGVTSMREMFERVREAAIGGAKHVLVATMHGELGRAGGGGPAGLVKTLAAEWPGIRARVVDLEPAMVTTGDAPALLHGELHAHDEHLEVGYIAGARSSIVVVPAELAPIGNLADVGLDANSVVLVTGGARGITARAAIAIANRYGCRIELVGRSPLPGPEDPSLAGAADARALRGVLAKQLSVPAEIEVRVARVLADREIRATLDTLGDRASYHAVDVRTPAFGELIDELYRRHGRLDGVIHGAGILEDKLMRHKTGESFERVFATKLASARTLVDKLRDDVKLVVMFSSISGAFGNRGQVDYAAAGDALDKLAWSLQSKIAGRVVSIDWGPWRGTGMAVDLEREYAKRGIGLIDPDAGIEALLDELQRGRDAQVILTATDPRNQHG